MLHIWQEGEGSKPGLNVGVTRRGRGIGSIVVTFKTSDRLLYLRLRWWPKFSFMRELQHCNLHK